MPYRHIDNRDGTITDTQTGLMWQEAYAYPETGSYFTWHEAEEYVAKLNQEKLGGHTDWRLPNRLELQSLYELNYPFESRGKTFYLHIDPIYEFSYGSCFWTNQTKLSAALGFDYNGGEMEWYPRHSVSGTARAVRLNMNPFKLLEFFPGK